MNSDRSNNLSLISPRFKPSGCRDIEIRTFKFVVKTQFPNGLICSAFQIHHFGSFMALNCIFRDKSENLNKKLYKLNVNICIQKTLGFQS